MKSNIKKTLKSALFTNPQPVGFKKEYKLLQTLIFPNQEDFILFLDTHNTEMEVEICKKIILRLNFETYFSPPTKLLFSILDLENSDLEDKFDTYISRDHFLHLVQLYLLGIYTFFYFSPIQKKIHQSFTSDRLKNNKEKTENSLKSIKEFIIGWKYFVLYHDIGYPFEKYFGKLPNNEDEKDKKNKYLKSLNNITKSINKDLTLRSIARIISLYSLLGIDEDLSLWTILEPYVKNDDELKVITQLINSDKFFRMKYIDGFESANYILKYINKEDISSVLYNDEFEPILFEYQNNGERKCKIINKEYSNVSFIKNIVQQTITSIDKACFDNNKFKWHYFSKNTESKLDDSIKKLYTYYDDLNLLPEKIANPLGFKTISDYISKLNESNLTNVVNDNEFVNYTFKIYWSLYSLVGYNKYFMEDIDFPYHENLNNVINDIADDLPNLISQVVNEKVKLKYDKDIFLDKLNNISLEAATKELVEKNLFTKDVITSISDDFNNKVDSKILLSKSLDNFRKVVSTIIGNKEVKSNLNIDIENDNFNTNEILVNSTIIDTINKKLQSSNLPHISELINYKPEYCIKQKRYIDHGIGSLFVLMDSLNNYDQIIRKTKQEFNSLLKIAIGFNTEHKNLLDYSFYDVFAKVGHSIVIHNLYPSWIKNFENYRTDIEKNPFAYLCILCDSLQDWNRRYSLNPAQVNAPYSSSSLNFNLEIKNSKITISEKGNRLNIIKRHAKLKKDLDSYLKNASSFIQLNLSEE